MKPTFKTIAVFFLGLIVGIVSAVIIVEKQFWFWHVTKDRDVLILEVRKINLEKEEIDDLIDDLEGFLKAFEEKMGIKEE